MSFTSSQAARRVSSILVSHHSADDLVSQGLPAGEARRSFVCTCLMERLSTMYHGLLICGLVIPYMVSSLLASSIFLGGVYDVFAESDSYRSIMLFMFGHVDDSCSQPLGACLLIFWASAVSKLLLLFLWNRLEDCLQNCLGDPTFRNLSACVCRSFAVVMVLFEVIWPATTFIMLLQADSCTPGLIASTWVVLSPHLLEALLVCCWPSVILKHPWFREDFDDPDAAREDPAEVELAQRS